MAKTIFSASLLSAVAILALSEAAQAVTFTFNESDNNLSTIIKTVDGITLTLTNPSPDTVFGADSGGLAVANNGVELDTGTTTITTSFSFSFSSPVQLNSYTINPISTFFLDGNESLNLSSGTLSSMENPPFVGGTRLFSNQFTLSANQIITLLANGIDDGNLIQWSSLTVTPVFQSAESVPESSAILGLLFVGSLGTLVTCKNS